MVCVVCFCLCFGRCFGFCMVVRALFDGVFYVVVSDV